MKKRSMSNILVNSEQYAWKRRPSEIRGFYRTLYLTTFDGDYIRIDYNLKEKRIRLYMEIDIEGGSPYYAIIHNGKITAEKSVASGRSFGFAEKFKERADVFSTIPNKDVLRLINGNYNIGKLKGPKTERQKQWEETKKRYFKREKNPYLQKNSGDDSSGNRKINIQIKLIDVIDFLVGSFLSATLFLYFQYSFIALGISSAFYGIIIGFVDMFLRGRSPVITKVVIFVLFGIISYIFGYFFS